MDEFQAAIREDPHYAAAYSGLADTLMFIGLYSLDRPRDMYERAETFIHKALSLDSRLPEAHVSLALIQLSAYWNWAAAENEFLRAIELDPTHAPAHLYYSWLLASSDGIGKPAWQPSARRTSIRCRRSSTAVSRGCTTTAANMTARSRRRRNALEVDPNFLVGLYVLGMAYR